MNINLDSNNLIALSKCDLKKQVIGIRTFKGQSEIVILSKKDVSWTQRLLRCINRGTLAHTETNLLKVASLLGNCSWVAASEMDKRTEEYKGYLKTCQFANKIFLKKKDTTLLTAVSKEEKIKNAVLTQLKNKKVISSEEILPKILLNPKMKFNHVHAQLQQKFHNSFVKTERDGEEYDVRNHSVRSFDFSDLTFLVTQTVK